MERPSAGNASQTRNGRHLAVPSWKERVTVELPVLIGFVIAILIVAAIARHEWGTRRRVQQEPKPPAR